MRIAIGGMLHESNTFTRETTDIDAFHTVDGDDVYESERWMTGRATGGIVDTLSAADLVPTYFAKALPSGTVTSAAYRRISGAIVDGIEAASSLDAVCLDLHGSMYVDGEDDPEGDLVTSVRDVVGPDTPVVCSLDMHATVTERFVDAVDGITGYRTAPHTDVYETGERAADLLRSVLDGEHDTVVERVRLPMLVAGEQSETDAAPMNDLMDRLRTMEGRDGVLSTAYFLGFPWADSPHNGVTAVVTGTRSADPAARETAVDLATAWWDRRSEFGFTTEAYPVDVALDEAQSDPRTPVVLADSGDNPTAGATEDLTFVLDRLLDREIEDALVAVVADPAAVATAREAGAGSVVDLSLGRVRHDPNAPGLEATGRVVTVGAPDDVATAVVETAGVTVVVTAERTAVTDPGFLEALDVAPASFDLVVVKSGYLSPAYQDVAARSMLALTPGDTNEVLTELPYEVTPRPIYPLDDDVTWRP